MTYDAAQRRVSRGLAVLCALGLSAVPLAAVINQSAKLNAGRTITLPVEISRAQVQTLVPMIDISVFIQNLTLSTISGDDYFSVGDKAHVFMRNTGGVWYPYAVLGSLPAGGESLRDDQIMITGQVSASGSGRIEVAYDFDRISPRRDFVRAALRRTGQYTQLELVIGADGSATVSALSLDGKRYSQRPSVKPVLDGFNIKTDSKAPPI